MKKAWLSCLVLLFFSSAVSAHRLNEYLEAMTISLARDKVTFELRLTPGVDVAPRIISKIDLDHDNRISADEQHAYLAILSRDMLVTIDGKNVVLQPASYSYPTLQEMRTGTGDIIIDYQAPVDPQQNAHRLSISNKHYSAIAVYLVNCLLPADTTIRVTGQTRNTNQSEYQLDFSTGGSGATAQQGMLIKADNHAVLNSYFFHGVNHILTGYDHLLFLCALVLGAAGLWDLVKIVTGFTIAHSITLTLATLRYAHLPEYIVEPIISASIIFVAIQNIWWPDKANGNSRLAVAFFFGLFHGLGFAGGLLELMHAMPAHLIVYAVLGFSVGVEAGNQLVLIPLYFVLRAIKQFPKVERSKSSYTFQQVASGFVAAAGLYYLLIAFAQ